LNRSSSDRCETDDEDDDEVGEEQAGDFTGDMTRDRDVRTVTGGGDLTGETLPFVEEDILTLSSPCDGEDESHRCRNQTVRDSGYGQPDMRTTVGLHH
jgi:hypothetical protein